MVTHLAGRTEPVKHKLDRHVNVMWGLNGSGKTSLLRILHAALNNEVQGLARVPFSTAEVHIALDPGEGTLVRRLDMHEEAEEDDEEGIEEEIVQLPDGSFEVVGRPRGLRWETAVVGTSVRILPGRLRHTYLPISRVADSRSAARRGVSPRALREGLDDSLFDTLFADQVRQRWQLYNTDALDRVRAVQQQGLAEILSLLFGGVTGERAKASAPAPGAPVAFELVTQFLARQSIKVNFTQRTFAKRYDEEPALRQVVRRIEGVLGDIDEAFKPQRALQSLIAELYSGNKELRFDSRGIQVMINEGVVPLESLSSGEKQLLQVLLETLASGSNTILIDEPELSMHVDWQNRLVRSMQTVNPDCQLLLATHSPEVMADVSDNRIFEL